MSVTINAKGTSVPIFTIGKNGLQLTQSGEITAREQSDLVLTLDQNQRVIISAGDNNDGVIATEAGQDLFISPGLGGAIVLAGSRWPVTLGNNGQVLTTNGTGQLSWSTPLLDTYVLKAGDTMTGNLGIGITPAAWGSSWKALQVGNGSIMGSATDSNIRLLGNAYYDGTNYRYLHAGPSGASLQAMGFSGYQWLNAPLGIAGNIATFTEQMTLDANGNLGIGVIPVSTAKLHVKSAIELLRLETTNPRNLGNTYLSFVDPTGFKGYVGYGNTGNDILHLGNLISSVALVTGGGERLIVDVDGNVLIGSTASSFSSPGRGVLEVNGPVDSVIALKVGGAGAAYMYTDDTGLYFNTFSPRSMIFRPVGTEQMRIDTFGNLTVRTSGVLGYQNNNGQTFEAGGYGVFNHANGTASATPYVAFGYNGIGIGSIIQSGTNTVVYNTASDYRLKDVVSDLINSGKFIDALKPRMWKWKSDNTNGVGFIAHEVAEICPSAVTGEKDKEDMQQLSYSAPELIANLVAEIKDLRRRLAVVEATL